MHNVEAKNCPTHSSGRLPPRSAFKSFNAQLAVDYPAYAMVICQVIDKLKLVLLFAVQYLTGRVKMAVIFVSYGSLALAFCQLQIRHRDEIVR